MPDRAFALARFWLRVDGVLLRSHETRVQCIYTEATLLREYSEKESRSWDTVRRQGIATDAADPNVAAAKLPRKSQGIRGEAAVQHHRIGNDLRH